MRSIRSYSSIVAAVIIAVTLFACTGMITRSLVRIKSKDELIHVDGSARKPIRSDFIVWNGSLSQSAATIAQAYGPLEASVGKVKAYLIAKGVPAAEILPDAVSEEPIYEQVKNLKTGQYVTTTRITGYTLTQRV